MTLKLRAGLASHLSLVRDRVYKQTPDKQEEVFLVFDKLLDERVPLGDCILDDLQGLLIGVGVAQVLQDQREDGVG